jgi:hypothetical protein
LVRRESLAQRVLPEALVPLAPLEALAPLAPQVLPVQQVLLAKLGP